MELLSPETLAKLVATAGVVVAATRVAERSDSFIGAMIAALPISAGPAYLFITLEHGVDFVSRSALAGVAVNAMMPVFLCAAAVLIPRVGLVAGLGIALALWVVGAVAVLTAAPGFAAAVALNVAVFPLCAFLSRHRLHHDTPPALHLRVSDVLLRVLAVVAIVLAVLIAERHLGPAATGIVALVPVVWLSMATILYLRLGAGACAAVLANGILGMFGFCLALGAIHLLVPRAGALTGLTLALVVSVGWNVAATLLRPHLGLYHRRSCTTG